MSISHTFSHFDIPPHLLEAITKLGYQKPTAIQEASIPILLAGHDLLAQAQTGSGKTAAFALPILSKLENTDGKHPQALVITPTRELAIQVADAFKSFSPQVTAVPIYGGQEFKTQLRSLKRNPQVIVGTPGRLMDHLRRKSLSLKDIKTIILDEADEMLKMGFIDDIEWILSHITQAHQTALFSATLPESIIKISHRYLKAAKKIQIKAQVDAPGSGITQCYVSVNRDQKLPLLIRFLEAEKIKACIIFTRTKNDASDLADQLQSHGYSAAALHGDMSQSSREKTIGRLRNNTIDILVATDVAARGIDIAHLSHVINYDIPFNTDAYTHRIGRTGRAERAGRAILFVTPREMGALRQIERLTKQPITRISGPTLEEIQKSQVEALSEKITGVLQEKDSTLHAYETLVAQIAKQCACAEKQVAAALLMLNDKQSSPKNDKREAAQPVSKKFARRDRYQHKKQGAEKRKYRDDGDRKKSDHASKAHPFRRDKKKRKKY